MTPLIRSLGLILVSLVVAGCGELRLSYAVLPDSSVNFSEEIILDQRTEILLGRLVAPGPNDFWGIMKSHCVRHNFKLRTMTSNRLVISGSIPKGSVSTLSDILDEQLVEVLTSYDFKKIGKGPILVTSAKANLSDGAIQKQLSATVNYDLTRDNLRRHFEPPLEVPRLFDISEIDTINFRIKVQSPYPITSSNGVIEGKTINWVVPFGKVGSLSFAAAETAWSILGGAILAMAVAVFLLLRASNKGKRAID